MSNEHTRTQLTQPKDDNSLKRPSEQPTSESGNDINGTDNNADGKEAEEGHELGYDGEGVEQDESDAKGENNIKLGGGTRERRDEEVEQQPTSYSTSDAIQVTAGVATPPPAPLERLPSTHLATPPSMRPAILPAALALSPPTDHIATPPAHLATPPSTHLATPPSAHLATPPSVHLPAQSTNFVRLESLSPTAYLATHAQDDTTYSGLGAMQGIQTPFMDLTGNDLVSFGAGTGFDTWSDPFGIPQVFLPGVGPTVVNPGFHVPPSAASCTVSPDNLGFMPSSCNLLQGPTGWNNTTGMHLLPPALLQPMNPDASGTAFSNMPVFDFSAVGSVGGDSNPDYTAFIPTTFNFGGVPDSAGTSQPSGALNPGPVNPLQTQYSTLLPSVSSPAMFSSLQPSSTAQSPEVPCEVAAPPSPLLPLPPTDPGVFNVSQTPTTGTSNDSATGVRSKRKYMPSLRAERDNAIGKKAQVPTPATRDGASKPKRGKPSNGRAATATKSK